MYIRIENINCQQIVVILHYMVNIFLDSTNVTLGEWGIWGTWSNCTAMCDLGFKVRQRQCLPNSQQVLVYCMGEHQDLTDCVLKNCTAGKELAKDKTISGH